MAKKMVDECGSDDDDMDDVLMVNVVLLFCI